MSLTVWLALGAMILWGVGDFLIARSVRRVGNLETLFWITLASSILLLPFIYQSLFLLTPDLFWILLSLGIFGFLGTYIYFKAFAVGKVSVVEVTLSLELPLTVLLGLIVFHDHITWRQWILVATSFLGIVLLSADFQNINRRHFFEKGALLALLSAVVISGINFLTAAGAKAINPILVIWFPWLVSCLLTLGYLLLKGQFRGLIKKSRPHFGLLIPMILIDIIAWVFYAFALRSGELSITTAITEGFVAIAAILGLVINREKIHGWQYLGMVLAITGSILIALIS